MPAWQEKATGYSERRMSTSARVAEESDTGEPFLFPNAK